MIKTPMAAAGEAVGEQGGAAVATAPATPKLDAAASEAGAGEGDHVSSSPVPELTPELYHKLRALLREEIERTKQLEGKVKAEADRRLRSNKLVFDFRSRLEKAQSEVCAVARAQLAAVRPFS